MPPAEIPALDLTALDGVDAAEEVAGPGAAQVGEGLGDGHLDILRRDLVGGPLGIDALEPLDHLVAGSPGERQARSLRIELRKACAATRPSIVRATPERLVARIGVVAAAGDVAA